MSPVAAGNEAGIRQKGEGQAAAQATNWVQSASQSCIRRRDLRMEQEKLAQRLPKWTKTGWRSAKVMGCFEKERITDYWDDGLGTAWWWKASPRRAGKTE